MGTITEQQRVNKCELYMPDQSVRKMIDLEINMLQKCQYYIHQGPKYKFSNLCAQCQFLEVNQIVYKIIQQTIQNNMGCFTSTEEGVVMPVKSNTINSSITRPLVLAPVEENKPNIPPTTRRAPKLVWKQTIQELYSQVEPVRFPMDIEGIENPEMLQRKKSKRSSIEQDMKNLVKKFFQKYDQGCKGYLTYPEYCLFWKQLDLSLQFTDENLKHFMKKTDSSGDGQIDQEELALMLKEILKL